MTPRELSANLRALAAAINKAKSPSRSQVASAIKTLIFSTDRFAAANPELAKILTDAIRATLPPKEYDFSYDALEGGVRGLSEDSMSFPARPNDFDGESGVGGIKPLNGTLLTKIYLDPPITGSGPEIAGEITTVTLESGFYFKTPLKDKDHRNNTGKYMFPMPAGSFEIMFDDDGSPIMPKPLDMPDLHHTLQSLSEHVHANIPPGAASLSRDPVHGKQQREKRENAKREELRELEKKKLLEEWENQKLSDAETHGSIEKFVAWKMRNEDPEFGPQDVHKIVNILDKDPAGRKLNFPYIKEKLIKEEGMEWNPTLSSTRPRSR